MTTDEVAVLMKTSDRLVEEVSLEPIGDSPSR